MMERSEFEKTQARELARLLTLLEGERRYYQEIVASLPQGLLIVSGDGHPVSANRAFRQMFGLRPDEWKRRGLDDLLPVPGLREAIDSALRTATPRSGFLALIPVDKAVQPFRLAILPVRNWDDDLELEAVVVVEHLEPGATVPATPEALPATAPEKPEPAPKATAAPPVLAMNPPVVLWTADPATLRFTSVAGATSSVLGYPPEHWTSQEGFFEARIAPEDRRALMEGVRAAVARGARYSFEYRSTAADGSAGWYRDTFHREGDLLVGLTADITTRRLVEDQLLQAQRNEALQQLASRLSHDLNNPLMIITGYGEEILNHFASDDPIRNDLQQIMDATARISRLSGQLLQFTRPQVQPAERVNLTRIVADLEEELHSAAVDASVTLSLPSKPVWGMASPAQLREVLLTLASGQRPDAAERTRLRVEVSYESLEVRTLRAAALHSKMFLAAGSLRVLHSRAPTHWCAAGAATSSGNRARTAGHGFGSGCARRRLRRQWSLRR
jgi:PAS domain-containing protein